MRRRTQTAARCGALLFSILLCSSSTVAAISPSDLLQKLALPGHFALMRHALAPGMGDPENLSLEDCSTQRNLDETGRQQARRAGNLLRANGVTGAKVYTSEWCRCRDTAELLGFSAVMPLSLLNSFFRQHEKGIEQTAQLSEWIGSKSFDQPVILVTHQVNITALTDVYPASGEIVILRKTAGDNFSVLGTVETID